MAEASTKKFVASLVISLALLTATVTWLWAADVSLTPTTFLIAPDGKIVLSKIGNINIENMEVEISSLLWK